MARKKRDIPAVPRNQEPGDQNMYDREIGDKLALAVDPMNLAIVQDYTEGLRTHTRFSTFGLRQMAQTPWDSAIIHTRLNQVELFSVPQQGPHSLGFAIRMKDHTGSPTAADKKEAARLTQLMMQCGEYQHPHQKFTRKGFRSFLRGITYDSLVLDAACFEIVPAWGKKSKDGMPMPVMWNAVDAGTIYRATPNNPYGEYDPDDCQFLQLINEQQVARWRPGEMAFGIRRYRTDIRNNDYGYPELCEMVDLVTGLLFGLVHNMNYFKQGGPRGVLAVMGQMPERQFRFFQKQFLYAASGVKNSFRTILTNPQGPDADLKWIPFGMPNKDMEFAEWNNFLFKLMCSLRQIDPSEVGIHYNTGGGEREPMFAQSPEAKIQAGRDKGLRPLLNFLADTLNLYLVNRLNPDFEIQFLGVGSMSETDEANLDKSLLEGPRTLNEVRGLKDLPEVEGGDVFLNPQWVALHQQEAQQAQQGGGAQGYDQNYDNQGYDQPPEGFDDTTGKALSPATASAVDRLLKIEINM